MQTVDRYDFTAGDTGKVISGTINDKNGEPIDISTGYDIRLHIGYRPPLVKVAVLSPSRVGGFYFPWEPDDLKPGKWQAEVQVSGPSGIITAKKTPEKQRFVIEVDQQIS